MRAQFGYGTIENIKDFINLKYQEENLLSPTACFHETILLPAFHLPSQTIHSSLKSFHDVKNDENIYSQLNNDTLKSFHDVKNDEDIYSQLNNDTLLQPHSQNQRNDSRLQLKFPVYTVGC